jgi:predicted DsbA family dithiol-disulfide isomerase
MASPTNPLKLRARALGIELAERDWVPSSRRAHECTEYARAERKMDGFHALVLKAYWSEARDIHAWPVLEACAATAGFQPDAMRAAVEAGQLVQAVDERVEAAKELGINAVPSFVIDKHYVVPGAQTADVFEKVFAQIGVGPRNPEDGST